MDIKKIRQLGELVKKLDLSMVEVCQGDIKIKIENGKSAFNANSHDAEMPKQNTPSACEEKSVATKNNLLFKGEIDFNNMKEIKSPMIGVFYSSPSPDSKPFVSIGETVKKGQVLCIIEAMKVMNEITSDHDGEIIDICTKNNDIVEYGQTLFKIY